MTEQTVIGYSTAELVDAMLAAGIHTSVDKFRRLAIEMQRRAINSVLSADGPAIEARVIEGQR